MPELTGNEPVILYFQYSAFCFDFQLFHESFTELSPSETEFFTNQDDVDSSRML